MNASVDRKVTAHRVLSGVLGLVCLLAWGLFLHATMARGALEKDLRKQMARLSTERDRLLEERNQLRIQVATLNQAHATPLASTDDATLPSPMPSQAASADQAETEGPEVVTGSVLSAKEVEASIRTAQMVLVSLGYGPLDTDGILGPQTRRALEAFERDQGLAASGELGRTTVKALRQAAEVASR